MLIPCPHCGPRDVGEFTYGGDATKERPDPGSAAAADWCDYVFQRENPRGPHLEYWHHAQGCRLWLKVRRDTATHRIEGAEIAGPWAGAEARESDSGEGQDVA
ncbi:sarcosine oxidase subunit delta [Pelagibius litoralis]|uniref:Sarcosine oxidase subunit delta n=1 Tax=Pelagibius litoralis TaxID=374515 RepID=A0A967CAH5_9PROT|nr:sarcosine oxidase subunit delta [Pelagibius litoralis]NIA67409.1 sarcosine oxidase subunit delta [Pelagibius litoralis]